MKKKYQLGQLMSDSPGKQFFVVGVLFVLSFGIVVLATWAIEHSVCINHIPSRMLSPIPLREALEEGNGNPWAVSIAFLVGVVVFSGVLIAVITNMIRTVGDRYLNGTAHYHFKNHILFLGYDELMMGTMIRLLYRSLDKPKHEQLDIVVVVPDNVANIREKVYQKLTKRQRKRVYVIYATRTRMEDLKQRVYVDQAESIYIIGQPEEDNHDTDNLRCLAMVAYLCRNKTQHTTYCMYHLQNQATLYLMHRLEYDTEDFLQYLPEEFCNDTKGVKEFIMKSEPFNFHESISRHVLIGNLNGGNYLSAPMTKGNPHFVIFGLTEMGYAMMRTVLMTQHFPEKKLHVTIVDPQAELKMHQLTMRHRPLFENCRYSLLSYDNPSSNFTHDANLNFLDVEIAFIQCEYGNTMLAEQLSSWTDNHALAMVICTDNTPDNIELALHMPLHVMEQKTPVWVYQSGDSSMNSFIQQQAGGGLNGIYQNVHIFSSEDYGTDDRRVSKEWQLAEKVSDNFEDEAVRNGEKNRITKWCSQQPKNRWSSLYGAISKIGMLRAESYSDKTLKDIHTDTISKMAYAEHNRWCIEKLLNGWWPSHDDKNNDYHKCIVSNEELARRDKKNGTDYVEKDFNQVKTVISAIKNEHLNIQL